MNAEIKAVSKVLISKLVSLTSIGCQSSLCGSSTGPGGENKILHYSLLTGQNEIIYDA